MSCLPVFAINCPNGVLSNYTISGNSVQNGTPTPSSPVDVVSVGDLVTDSSDPNYGKYKIPVVVGANMGVVDLGTLTWYRVTESAASFFWCWFNEIPTPSTVVQDNIYLQSFYTKTSSYNMTVNKTYCAYKASTGMQIRIRDDSYTDAASFKATMTGKYLYYQRATDSSWTAPSVTYIYANAPLRKVGNYADVLNSDGTITRNVIAVDANTLSWTFGWSNAWYTDISNSIVPTNISVSSVGYLLSEQYIISDGGHVIVTGGTNTCASWVSGSGVHRFAFNNGSSTETPKGMIYYPLATAITENITLPSISMNNGDNIVTIGTSVAPSGTNVWPASLSCILASAGIKVATTKYVETAFADSVSELNATMGTIKNVVDNTIIQADRIGKLATGKQNRPAENCPDGAQCLLITEADGSLHWYPICNADGTVGTQNNN